MEAGLRGAQKLPPPREGAPPRAGAGGLRRPRTEAGARRPEQVEAERRREGKGRLGGRPAPRLPRPGWAPAAAGKQGARGADAGRSEQLFSLAGARRGGGEGAGTLAPGQGDSFFRFKASSLPPGGARVCGRVEAGGGPRPRCPPRRNPPPPPRWARSRGPSPGTAGRPAGFLRAGPGGPRPPPARGHQSGPPRLGEARGAGALLLCAGLSHHPKVTSH